MTKTSEEMLKNVEGAIDKLRDDLKENKEELKNLENRLRVEDIMLAELEAKKNAVADEQKYVVMAIKDEIELQKNKIIGLEVDLRLFFKKHEVLKRDWDF